MARLDLGAVREQAGALEQVAQFPDIAFETHRRQLRQRRRRQAQRALGRDAGEQRFHQQRQVLGPLAQRGRAHGEGVDPEIEVAAECVVRYHRFEVPVGGGHQAEVGAQGIDAADAPVSAGFQQAQQLDLKRKWQLADFVKEQSSSRCRFNQALLAVRGTGEGAFFIAEQFRFEQRFRQTGAIHGDERPLGARTGLVNHAGDEFLARAGFAQQHDRGFRGCGACDQPEHAREGRRTSNQPLRRRPAAGMAHHAHRFDEIADAAGIVAHRRCFDIDMLLAARRLMQMQHAPAMPIFAGAQQGAGFAGLVAGRVEAVRDLVAKPADHRPATPELARVGGIGGDDAIAVVHDDARLGEAVKKRYQFVQLVGRAGYHVSSLVRVNSRSNTSRRPRNTLGSNQISSTMKIPSRTRKRTG